LLGALALAVTACSGTRAEPFPQVDSSKLKITLTRGACYGTCPDYQVTIYGGGRVIFSTREDSLPGSAEAHREFNPFPYVVAPGTREYRIDPKAVDALLEKFKAANFFALKSHYTAQVTDNPTYEVEIDTGHGRKSVIDYVGKEVGMPAAVSELENAIDDAAQTARFVSGADGLVDVLASEGFDFRSEEAARMLVQAIEAGGDQTLIDLVGRGAPLELVSAGGPYGVKGKYGTVALLTSIREGRATLFSELVGRGWLKRTDGTEVADAFAGSGAGCSPALASASFKAGIKVDATARNKEDMFGASGGATALSSLGSGYTCRDEKARLATAARLLALGADPNHRNDEGKTPIFAVENLALLNLLIANGSDPKAIDNSGASAVFDSWTDEIVLRLLEAGASAKGNYYDGKNLWEQMKERPMPKVKAWLAKHPTQLADAQSK
jgi:hypothetical protein